MTLLIKDKVVMTKVPSKVSSIYRLGGQEVWGAANLWPQVAGLVRLPRLPASTCSALNATDSFHKRETWNDITGSTPVKSRMLVPFVLTVPQSRPAYKNTFVSTVEKNPMPVHSVLSAQVTKVTFCDTSEVDISRHCSLCIGIYIYTYTVYQCIHIQTLVTLYVFTASQISVI